MVGGSDEGQIHEIRHIKDTKGREFVYINVCGYLYESGYLYGL